MDSGIGPPPTAAKWGFRVALAIGCLALLFVFVNPLVAVFQSGLCFAFALGIRRRHAWAAIAGAGFWLIPAMIVLLSGNGLTADLIATITMSLVVGLLMLWATATLWQEPAARSGSAPWIAFLCCSESGLRASNHLVCLPEPWSRLSSLATTSSPRRPPGNWAARRSTARSLPSTIQSTGSRRSSSASWASPAIESPCEGSN